MRGARTSHISRIRVINILFILFLLFIVGKLYIVQIVHGDKFSEKADRQYVQTPGTSFERGSIFFTTKNGEGFSAASLKTGYILAIKPALITKPNDTYEKIREIIEVDRSDFLEKANKKEDPYEEVARKVDEESAQKIKELNIDGVSLHPEKWRFYPGNNLASHILGFVSYTEDKLTGAYGVERQQETVLADPDDTLYVNFFAEVFTGLKQIADAEDRQGDVYLTIEPTVQLSLEQKLQEVKEEWGSKRVSGVIINPKTGEIYAMASAPDFDLNNFRDVDDPAIFGNPIVENVYEMGSIIKPLTVAAGLDAGVISPGTTYNDTGSLTMDGKKISNYDGRARGVVSMQEVLNQSLNTGVAFITRELGTKRFANYFEKFGIRDKSGVDLPNESEGLTDNLDSPRRIEYATASYGQGIAMNPLVTVRALSALGNGGTLITPHVTKRVDYDLGMDGEYEIKEGERVISEKASEEITRMLVKVVDDALIGGKASLDRWTIAAKTGTAQIPGPGGKYYDDRYLHTFFGYFPAYDPEFLVFLMNEEPVGARYASETLTLPFADLTKFLLNYYEIEPDR